MTLTRGEKEAIYFLLYKLKFPKKFAEEIHSSEDQKIINWRTLKPQLTRDLESAFYSLGRELSNTKVKPMRVEFTYRNTKDEKSKIMPLTSLIVTEEELEKQQITISFGDLAKILDVTICSLREDWKPEIRFKPQRD